MLKLSPRQKVGEIREDRVHPRSKQNIVWRTNITLKIRKKHIIKENIQ